MLRTAAVLLVLVVLASCASGPESVDVADADPVTEAAEPTATVEAAAPTAAPTATLVPEPTATAEPTEAEQAGEEATPPDHVADLAGRWAHYDVVAYEDGILKTLIISYGFNDFREVGGNLVDQGSFCFSEQLTDQAIETSLSDAATQAIIPPPTGVTVDVVEGVVRIFRPSSPTPVGIRLDDPFNTPLPTDPNDPRIVDDDGDGNPGITVTITLGEELTGELYLARREIYSYEAELVEPDLLVGSVIDESEQLIIGASNPVFAAESAWVQHPDPERSPIILRRVDTDWDCDRLKSERDELFPANPVIDW